MVFLGFCSSCIAHGSYTVITCCNVESSGRRRGIRITHGFTDFIQWNYPTVAAFGAVIVLGALKPHNYLSRHPQQGHTQQGSHHQRPSESTRHHLKDEEGHFEAPHTNWDHWVQPLSMALPITITIKEGHIGIRFCACGCRKRLGGTYVPGGVNRCAGRRSAIQYSFWEVRRDLTLYCRPLFCHCTVYLCSLRRGILVDIKCSGCSGRWLFGKPDLIWSCPGYIRAHILVILSLHVLAGPNKHGVFTRKF